MKIAFFTLNAYDMLTGGYEGSAVGGAQVQQILIGKELSSRGHDIYFVEYDSENKTERTVDGIQVVTKSRPSGPEVQRAYTVVRGTRQVLKDIAPDICYRRSLDFEILTLSYYSAIGNNRFIYGISHDDELSDTPRKYSTGIKSSAAYLWLNKKSISNADAVIAQNSTQYNMAAAQLSTTILQIPNCYTTNKTKPIEWEYESPTVFWAARLESWKQPGVVTELAEKLPEIEFIIAGGPGDEKIFSMLKNRESEIDNLHVLGHVPFSKIDRYFAAADIFLNTSEEEGFPNSFLQAWANQTPVVSLNVNPNNILTDEKIGRFADNSFDRLQTQIKELVTNQEMRNKLGDKSNRYLQKNHSVQAIADRYMEVFVDHASD
jgi:glycosyltransferase involved in cell wall biosynthesis